jgi:hypothetical protein
MRRLCSGGRFPTLKSETTSGERPLDSTHPHERNILTSEAGTSLGFMFPWKFESTLTPKSNSVKVFGLVREEFFSGVVQSFATLKFL